MSRFFSPDGKRFYAACQIPCQIGGRGYAVHRIGTGNTYHVRIGEPDETHCECLGFLRWDHCVHLEGILKLEKA